MRESPFWPALELVAHTLAYDGTFMAPTERGDPGPLKKWASVAVPVLVMDGGASPPWLRNAAQALVDIVPAASRRTLEDQTHQVAPEVLAPALIDFFSG
jgi:hypothetical protein